MADVPIHSATIVGDDMIRGRGDPAAVFPWWSFTKTVIAAAALRLAEYGRLALDEALPDRPYTLGQLLQNIAGVPDYGGLREYHAAVAAGEPAWSRDELLRRVDADRLEFPPGQGWAYSNVGYLFARERIEACAGVDLGSALHELVLAPLGLHAVRLARALDDFRAVHWKAVHGYDPGWVFHGCLLGTAPEACRLLHALARGELLGEDSLARMRRARPIGGAVPGRPWVRHDYGLGLMIGTWADERGTTSVVGHTGGGPGCVNAVYHFPDLGDGVTVACFAEGPNEAITEWEALRLARLDVAAARRQAK